MNFKGKITKIRKELSTWWKRTQKDYVKKKYSAEYVLFVRRQNALVRTKTHLRGHNTFYYTLIYFTIAAAISSFSQLWFAKLDAGSVFNFYTSAGAMAGGTLAIIFSFNALLVNFALTQYPPEFFKLSGYDKTQDKIYFLITALTVGLFVMSFMYRDMGDAWQYWLRYFGLMFVFAVFYLIFLSYCLIRRRLNPTSSFGLIVGPAMTLLDKTEKDARRIAELLRKNPGLKPDKAYVADYQPHMLMQSRYEELARFIGYLYDYHDKLLDKKDYHAALSVLDAIGSIILRFIEVRKNSFLLMPSADYILVPVTDSQTFFDTNFQRMVDRAKVYIKLGNQDGTRKVVDLFQGIGLTLSELKFPNLERENPPFAQCIHYLGDVCDASIKEDSLEATFQLARTYSWLGAAAITRGYDTQSAIYDNLVKLALYAGAKKQMVVMEQVGKAFAACAEAFTKVNRGPETVEFKIFMDKMGEFLWYYVALTAPGTDYQTNVTENITKPIRVLVRWLNELCRSGSYNGNPDRLSDQRDAIELAEQIRGQMRTLSDRDKLSLINRYLVTQLSDLICDAAGLLITSAHKRSWQRNSSEALNNASWLISQVAFFTNNAPDDVTGTLIDTVSNKVTDVSLFALNKGDSKIASAGAYVNYELAMVAINKITRSPDYDAARIMANTGIIAVLALHKQDIEVLKKCKELTEKFNAAYKQKFFPNGLGFNPQGRGYTGTSPQQLYTELRRIARETTGSPRFAHAITEYPEHYLLRLAPQTQHEHFDAIIRYFKRP